MKNTYRNLFRNTYELAPKYDSHASFYGKAFVALNEKGNRKVLYSYQTLVAGIKDGELIIYSAYSDDWWSVTTRRHIAEFFGQEIGRALKPSEAKKMARIINE